MCRHRIYPPNSVFLFNLFIFFFFFFLCAYTCYTIWNCIYVRVCHIITISFYGSDLKLLPSEYRNTLQQDVEKRANEKKCGEEKNSLQNNNSFHVSIQIGLSFSAEFGVATKYKQGSRYESDMMQNIRITAMIVFNPNSFKSRMFLILGIFKALFRYVCVCARCIVEFEYAHLQTEDNKYLSL